MNGGGNAPPPARPPAVSPAANATPPGPHPTALLTKESGNAVKDAVADIVDKTVAPFENLKDPNVSAFDKAQGVVGAVAGLAGASTDFMNNAFARATNSISQALPSFPAAVMGGLVMGMPHTHTHLPSLIPPAPPIPLPARAGAMRNYRLGLRCRHRSRFTSGHGQVEFSFRRMRTRGHHPTRRLLPAHSSNKSWADFDGIPDKHATKSSEGTRYNAMKNPDELELEARVRAMYARKSSSIDASTKSAIENYLDHAEFEMAFEGLCIELVASASLSRRDATEFIELATALGLEREAVLDHQIVAKLKSILRDAR